MSLLQSPVKYWSYTSFKSKIGALHEQGFEAHTSYESTVPITYQMITDFWKDQTGLTYKEHYVIKENNIEISESDLVNFKAHSYYQFDS